MRDEGQRRHYLAAIGVPCLVPRFILPGAAVSRRCQPPVSTGVRKSPIQITAPPAAMQADRPAVPDSGVPAPAGRTGADGDGDPARATIDALVEPLTARASLRSESEPETRAARPAGAVRGVRQPVAQFSLTLCRSADWLVVDQGPAPGRDYLALLGNLLHVCGRAAAVNGSAVQGEAFQWPPALHRPVQLDTSQAAAAQVLHSRILTLHQRQPLRRILVLGRFPAALLADMPDIPDLQSLALPTGLWHALAEPQAKRSLWLDLAAAGWL